MLIDFSVLKQCLRAVLEKLDHSNLNDREVFEQDPSAERIAHYIFENIEESLHIFGVDSSLLSAVEVFETPVNMARYER